MSLPQGWVEVTVGDVAEITSGFGFPKQFQGDSEGEIPFAKVSDISRSVAGADGVLSKALNYVSVVQLSALRAKTVPSGSTVFAKIGEAVRLNRRSITDRPLVVDNNVMALTPIDGLCDKHYLYRWTHTIELGPLTVATTVPSVRRGDVASIAFPLAPVAEQRRVVAKLDLLNSSLIRARAELSRVPQLAHRNRIALMRAGVRGELTSELRDAGNCEPVAALLKRVPPPQQGRGGREATDKLRPGSAGISVNDPGTALPEGWQWVPLLRLAKQESGHTPSRSRPEYWDGGVPWIGIRDAGTHHGRAISQSIQTVSDAGLANSSARLLPAGTVCLSRTASVGYVTILARPMATSQDFATWTCTEALLPEYLMFALMAEGDDIRKFGMGSTHTTIYFPEIRAFHIALPPVAEQQEIVNRIKSGVARADRLEAEATRARALLDRLEAAILAKAFRGELVPQDPNDEPATALLARICTQRGAATKIKRGRPARVASGA